MNAFAALLWEKHGTVWYAVDGYYYSGRDEGSTKTDEEYGADIDRFTDRLRQKWERETQMGRGEYGRKLKVIIDPSAASFIALLRKKHFYHVIPANNSVIDGIRDTATAMVLGLIKISPIIKEWRQEVEGYVWDDNAGDDRPLKVDDHLMDAMRYFVETMNLVVKSKRRNQ
jgi:hypothetical protein